MPINAYAAPSARADLAPFEYEPDALKPDEVEIDIHYCGICHSDLSLIDNSWFMSEYPLVPGHEVAGVIKAKGEAVTHLEVGQQVGAGWFSRSCMTCPQCMGGDHNLCGSAEGIALGRYGGFADRVTVQSAWATPLPTGLDLANVGPLFCGGITVFNPIVQFNVKPTDRVGVVGIGGLGHMALQFLNKWGCEVTAFSSNPAKEEEARQLGAHHVVNSRDSVALENVAGSFDFILVTVNVPLDWEKYVAALRPKGRLHVVGAVMEPIPVTAFSLLMGQKSVSGTPLGSPANTATMLDFCARHEIEVMTEQFPLEQINEAITHLRDGKARYRVVLDCRG
jgi:uncharacterized zinc-type alcohol dehydrogenase-like protein